MEITAAMVKTLRARTDAPMMECKKALQEAGGDIEAAIKHMRESGMANAAKKAGRIAAEGNIIIRQNAETDETVMLEINSETDFVAKDDGFKAFGDNVAECILANQPTDVDALMSFPGKVDASVTLEELRQQLVAKIGENISVRRFILANSKAGTIGSYLHGNLRIGVLVDVEGGDAALAKDLAMHIAGTNPPPICINEDEVPEAMLAQETEIFTAQAKESGKPPEIIEKMVSGKMKKFIKDITLLSQPFVKDPDQTVGQLLAASGASLHSFTRYEVGEGLEKRSDNFAEEVMAQAKGG